MNPLGISDDLFKTLTEQRRTKHFLAACRRPEMWQRRALLHKRAADIIYDIGFTAWERDMAKLQKELANRVSGVCTSRILEGQELEDFEDQLMLGEYLILIGYGIECMLKGYLLAIIPDLASDERLDKLIAVHNIPQLCHECGISLSLDEERLMRVVTRNIEWGKYTAPLKKKDMPSWTAPEDQEEKSFAILNPFHERRIQVLSNAVFERAGRRLEYERLRLMST
jgi:hypothetical protein